jgi:carboxypeptidase D
MFSIPFLPSAKKGGAIAMLLSALTLLLSPVLVSASSSADYYVSSLPGAPQGPFLKMHAG